MRFVCSARKQTTAVLEQDSLCLARQPKPRLMSNSKVQASSEANGDTMPSLSSYLSRMRSVAFPRNPTPKPSSTSGRRHNGASGGLTLVMGNASADLDSFISSVVVSYFYNLRRGKGSSAGETTYVPVLNLPGVRVNELWRLRPEFGAAVRLAMGDNAHTVEQASDKVEQGKIHELEQLITIADVRDDENSPLHSLFQDDKHNSNAPTTDERQDLFLVDHNAPLIAGLSDETIKSRFRVVACIDHHVDEKYVPEEANPKIITTGIGSCTSLVVKHLRDQGMWPSEASSGQGAATSANLDIQEMARLALAPILIDTGNLKATGDKCSDTDREAVKFLESLLITDAAVSEPSTQSKSQATWNRDEFHDSINKAKANSLNLLTMQEIFDRDYKVWSECPKSAADGEYINVGISSLVKPLSWLIKHAGGVDDFLDETEAFATNEDRKLGVFGMLMRAGDRKEVAVLAFDHKVKRVIEGFEAKGGELQLEQWEKEEELLKALSRRFGANGEAKWKVWWMGDTSKSRKQVGPLLREAVRDI